AVVAEEEIATAANRGETDDDAGHHDDELEREASLRRAAVSAVGAFGLFLVGFGRRFVLRCHHRSSLREGARSRQDKTLGQKPRALVCANGCGALASHARQEWLMDTCRGARGRNYLPGCGAVTALSARSRAFLISAKPLIVIDFHRWHGFCTSPLAAAWESGRRTR